jgi:hypothetical protein
VSYSIQTDDANKLVIAKFWAKLNAEVFLGYISEMEKIGAAAENYDLLVLFHKATEIDLKTSEIRDFAHRKAVFSANSKRVILAPGALAFGLARVFGMESPNASGQYTTVKNAEQACEVLEIPFEKLEAGLLVFE